MKTGQVYLDFTSEVDNCEIRAGLLDDAEEEEERHWEAFPPPEDDDPGNPHFGQEAF
jgi:hypothetical protein